jgi:hypothetical protein
MTRGIVYSVEPGKERSPSKNYKRSISLESDSGQNKEFSQAVSRQIQANPWRRSSLTDPNGGYRLTERLPVFNTPQDKVIFHLTTQDNFNKIVKSGGLMPKAHQPALGSGLDDTRGDSFGSVEEIVKDYVTPLHVSHTDQESIKNLQRKLAKDAIRGGVNPQSLYVSLNPESIKDYIGDFRDQDLILMR